jgi:hypothetical protein
LRLQADQGAACECLFALHIRRRECWMRAGKAHQAPAGEVVVAKFCSDTLRSRVLTKQMPMPFGITNLVNTAHHAELAESRSARREQDSARHAELRQCSDSSAHHGRQQCTS